VVELDRSSAIPENNIPKGRQPQPCQLERDARLADGAAPTLPRLALPVRCCALSKSVQCDRRRQARRDHQINHTSQPGGKPPARRTPNAAPDRNAASTASPDPSIGTARTPTADNDSGISPHPPPSLPLTAITPAYISTIIPAHAANGTAVGKALAATASPPNVRLLIFHFNAGQRS
jgi:hypothetical protein